MCEHSKVNQSLIQQWLLGFVVKQKWGQMGGVGTDSWILPILKKKTKISCHQLSCFLKGFKLKECY